MKILVLAGGYNSQYDNSFSSGNYIVKALSKYDHEVLLLDVYQDFPSDFSFTKNAHIQKELFSQTQPTQSIKTSMIDLWEKRQKGNILIGKNILPICEQADVVFLALQGSIAKDGRLQAILDCYGIPYTGSSYTASILAANKNISKQLMVQNNILTPLWACYSSDDYLSFIERASTIQPPYIIKPTFNTFKFNIIAENRSLLNDAYEKVCTYENTLLIEKYICGRKFSVGILDGIALPISEILSSEEFYNNKYKSNSVKIICPAPLSSKLTKKLKKIAEKVHHTLELGYYSQIDFVMDTRENFYCLEVHTLPNLEPNNILSQGAQAANIDYSALCELIAAHPQKPFITLF